MLLDSSVFYFADCAKLEFRNFYTNIAVWIETSISRSEIKKMVKIKLIYNS